MGAWDDIKAEHGDAPASGGIPQDDRGKAERYKSPIREAEDAAWKWLGGAAANVPANVGRIAKGMWDVGSGIVMDPFQGFPRRKAIAKTLSDPQSREQITNALIAQGKGVLEDPLGAIQRNPVDAAMLLSGGSGLLSKGAEAAGLARTAQGLGTIAKATDPMSYAQKGVDWFLKSKTADAIIDASLAKAGIKPTVKSGPEIQRFQQQSRSAVKDIVKNKPNLVVDGDAGQLPQSVMGFSQAVDQTKDALFLEYNTLLQRATQTGGQQAVVDTAPILASLNAIKTDPAFATHGGKSAMFALNDLIDAYSAMPNLTLPEAQNFIKTLNRRLEAFYKNPTDAAVGEAYVNAEIASKLRSELDAVIARLQGPGYQDLKTRYGALSAIEDKVAKSAVKSTGKKTGFEDMLTDKYSGVKMMYGLATGKLPAIAAGGAVKALGWWQKGMLNPNNIVRKMFEGVEKRSGQFQPSRKVPARIAEPVILSETLDTLAPTPEYSSREEWERQ